MKLIIATAAAALVSTAAFAEMSTKEQDMRLDTSSYSMNDYETSSQETAGSIYEQGARATSGIETTEPNTTFSTRNDMGAANDGSIYDGSELAGSR